MKVTLHPGAEKDIEDAAAFYAREGSAVLAARFVAEFKRLAGLIVQHPGIGSPRSKVPGFAGPLAVNARPVRLSEQLMVPGRNP